MKVRSGLLRFLILLYEPFLSSDHSDFSCSVVVSKKQALFLCEDMFNLLSNFTAKDIR